MPTAKERLKNCTRDLLRFFAFSTSLTCPWNR
jgi:hypothetical protein